MSSFGFSMIDMEMATLWRIPPESSWGYCSSTSSGLSMHRSLRRPTITSLGADSTPWAFSMALLLWTSMDSSIWDWTL